MEDKNVKCKNCKEVDVGETLNTLRKDKEVRDKAITNIIKELNKIVSENFNLKGENEKLRKEKSRLSSELQSLTEIYNECKKENDDLKRKEKSKTMRDECEMQPKEYYGCCTIDTLEELIYFLMR